MPTYLGYINAENARKVMCTQLQYYWVGVMEGGLVKKDFKEDCERIYSRAKEIALQTGQDLTDFPEQFPPNWAELWAKTSEPNLSDEEIGKRLADIQKKAGEDRQKYIALGKRLEERLGASSR